MIADEVCDVSDKEQLSMCLHCVHDKVVKEMFLDVVEVERITGNALANTLLHYLALWTSHIYSDMHGQGYDGSSNMSGARNGCKEIVQKHAPLTTYTHCAAHRLNLAIVSACHIQEFKSTEASIGEITRFLKYLAKRQRSLERYIDSLAMAVPFKAQKLKDACRTRRMVRIDTYAVFLELLPTVQCRLLFNQISSLIWVQIGTGMAKHQQKHRCSLWLVGHTMIRIK